MADIRLGVLCWNQYTDWQSLLEAGTRVDELGYHSLWTWDHLYPILIGGGGEQVTLKLVARYGDANNVGGGIENVKRKERILREHCEAVGRDDSEIERTVGIGRVLIRDSREEARRVMAGQMERNG